MDNLPLPPTHKPIIYPDNVPTNTPSPQQIEQNLINHLLQVQRDIIIAFMKKLCPIDRDTSKKIENMNDLDKRIKQFQERRKRGGSTKRKKNNKSKKSKKKN
tara:strand:- start:308 stop:613 length:306 start_codon:yes stop_codon:yes gene_type:complete